MDKLPADFDRALWLGPLTFQGLVGSAIVGGFYSDLFRADGFAKPIADLMQHRKIAAALRAQRGE